ncbi:hypothetical protein [Brevibacillus sp. 179-C9.3 HS]|uniref:hypothetical protein n=1 Tax=unclassified Brevibacillus TaxID=2684853 RepID=UPI0039A057FB
MIRERPDDLARMLHWIPYSVKNTRRLTTHQTIMAIEPVVFLIKCRQWFRVKTRSISGWIC